MAEQRTKIGKHNGIWVDDEGLAHHSPFLEKQLRVVYNTNPDDPCEEYETTVGSAEKVRTLLAENARKDARIAELETDIGIAERIYRGYEDAVRAFVTKHPEFTYREILLPPEPVTAHEIARAALTSTGEQGEGA